MPAPTFAPSRDTGFVSVDLGEMSALDTKKLTEATGGGWAARDLGESLARTVDWWVGEMRARFEAEAAGDEGAEGQSSAGAGADSCDYSGSDSESDGSDDSSDSCSSLSGGGGPEEVWRRAREEPASKRRRMS